MTQPEAPVKTTYRIGEYETCTATKDGVRCVLYADHDQASGAGPVKHIGHNPVLRISRVWWT
ncbi:hypothetical protein [Kribbella solani]|uniref:Uncharacterized protein n=1 Tax=Kribbella solani TaxID=236067 RepID=A0A841E0N1_9ACTN|nr:hypothetical protein [Kribbella solani]MBB5984009.1 hypothetical protein [Kribbella solani]